jgi:hypothetical protein
MIRPGRYRHYKGGEYEVLGCARHSETEDAYVVYRRVAGAEDWWIRPLAMFTEAVMVNGCPRPRFERIEDGP